MDIITLLTIFSVFLIFGIVSLFGKNWNGFNLASAMCLIIAIAILVRIGSLI